MSEPPSPFSYLILRLVPSVERGERLNIGVVLFCRQLGFLGARVGLDHARLTALDPELAMPEVADHLNALVRVCDGAPGAGAIAALPPSERFGWLAAPSSTIVQASEVHTGLCHDPHATLNGLYDRLVESPGASASPHPAARPLAPDLTPPDPAPPDPPSSEN